MSYDMSIHTNSDPYVWAKFFLRTAKLEGWELPKEVDEELMMVWFANAMVAKVSPSEALYMFGAWLTTREEKVTFSHKHDASKMADLISEFCKANNLDEPRENMYPKNLKHPSI
jgi:hypothetical protein